MTQGLELRLELAKRIDLALRRTRGTVEDVAKAMDQSPSLLSHWRYGRRLPDAVQLARLAEALHTTPNELLGASGVSLEEAVPDHESYRIEFLPLCSRPPLPGEDAASLAVDTVVCKSAALEDVVGRGNSSRVFAVVAVPAWYGGEQPTLLRYKRVIAFADRGHINRGWAPGDLDDGQVVLVHDGQSITLRVTRTAGNMVMALAAAPNAPPIAFEGGKRREGAPAIIARIVWMVGEV
jgi:transcriptional regulator with XRE-family HTH domain